MISRSVGFVESWTKKGVNPTKTIYSPGLLNPSTLLPGRIYSGKVERIDLAYQVRYRNQGEILLAKAPLETILSRFEIPGGTGVLNLMALISLTDFTVNTGEEILVKIADISVLTENDFITLSGSASEESSSHLFPGYERRFTGLVTETPIEIFPANPRRTGLLLLNTGEKDIFFCFGDNTEERLVPIPPGWYFTASEGEVLSTKRIRVQTLNGETSKLEGLEG